jgi:hypothetical protein
LVRDVEVVISTTFSNAYYIHFSIQLIVGKGVVVIYWLTLQVLPYFFTLDDWAEMQEGGAQFAKTLGI